MKQSTNRKIVFGALVGTVIVLIILYIRTQGDKLADAFIPNLIAGFIGSLVTIFVIDRLLTAEKIRNDKKYTSLAEKRVALHIRGIQNMFGEIIKSVVTDAQNLDGVTTYPELFTTARVSQLRYFDFMQAPPELTYSSWMDYASNLLKTAEERCTQIINSYFMYLDPDLIEIIDKLFTSHVYIYTKNADKVLPLMGTHSPLIKGFVGYLVPSKILIETFERLNDVTARLQALNPEISFQLDANLLHPSVAPAPGSCRLPVSDVDNPPSTNPS